LFATPHSIHVITARAAGSHLAPLAGRGRRRSGATASGEGGSPLPRALGESPPPPPPPPQPGEGAHPGRRARVHQTSTHKPKTNSMVCSRCSRSSGVWVWRRLLIGLSPERIATYCLPFTSNVIGGALKPVPTLIFQSCSMVVSS